MASQSSSKRQRLDRHEQLPPFNFASMINNEIQDGLGIVQTNGQMIDPTNSVHSMPVDHISVPGGNDNMHPDATPISSLTSAFLFPPAPDSSSNLFGCRFTDVNPGESQVSIALGKAVKINLFRYWKFAKEVYDWHFDTDPSSIYGFLLDVLHFNTNNEKWWDDNRKTVKVLLTTQRNNTIKNIQFKFKGASIIICC